MDRDSESRGGRDRGRDRGDREMMSNKYDDPPNSRLFIVCGKQITEEQFKEEYKKFKPIQPNLNG